MIKFSLLTGLVFSGLFATAQDYKNPKLAVERRVTDLLACMTLEVKVAQLRSVHAGRPKLTDDFFNNTQKLNSMYGNGAGMMNPAFDETIEQTIERRNKLQIYLKTKIGWVFQ